MAESDKAAAPSERRPRRRRRLVLLALVVLVGAVAAAPWLLAPFVPGFIASQVADEIDGDVRVDDVSLSWGTARIAGLHVTDRNGATVARVDSLVAELDVLAALGERWDTRLDLRGAELRLREDDDGRINIAGLLGGPGDDDAEMEAPSGPAPDVTAHVSVQDVTVVVEGESPASTTELRDLAFTLDVDGLDRPAPFRMDATVHGNGSPAGRLAAEGSLTVAADGELGGDGLRGEVTYTLDDLILAAMGPAAALVAPVDALAGTLTGTGSWRLDGVTELTGESEIRLADLELTGAGGQPFALPVVELRANAETNELGGQQELTLTAGDLVTVRYDGRTHGAQMRESLRDVSGTLEADGELSTLWRLLTELGLASAAVDEGGPIPRDGPWSLHASVTGVDFETRSAEHLGLRVDVPDDGNQWALFRAWLGVIAEDVIASEDGLVVPFTSLSGRALGVQFDTSGTLELGDDAPRADLEGTLSIDVDDMLRAFAPPGPPAEPSYPMRRPVEGPINIEAGPDGIRVLAALTSRELRLDLPPSTPEPETEDDDEPARRTLTLHQLDVQLDVTADADAQTIAVNSSRVAAWGFAAEAKGTLSHAGDAPHVDLDVTAEADLRRITTDVHDTWGMADDPLPDMAGDLSLRVALEGDRQQLGVRGDVEIENLSVPLPAEGGGDGERVLREERVRVDFAGTLDGAGGAIALDSCRVESGLVTGDFTARVRPRDDEAEASEGLHIEALSGDLVYDRERWLALFGPELPLILSGPAKAPLTFEGRGDLARLDRDGVLAGLHLDLRSELGSIAAWGLPLSGPVTLALDDGTARVGARLAAGEGGVNVDAVLGLVAADDGAPALGAHLEADLTSLTARAETGAALASLHPLFMAADRAGAEATVSAVLDGRLTVDYRASLLDVAERGFDLGALDASGRLHVTDASLAGTTLLAEILSALERPAQAEFDLAPVVFALRDGRVVYDEPWTWTIGGHATTFTGSVGLDRTVDLSWNLPVTAELASDHSSLRHVEGETVVVPIGGTLDAPRLHWDGVLSDLARTAAERKLEERLRETIGAGNEQEGEENDPEAILAQANALWSEGRREDAVPLYKRLREDFKYTLTYLLNKDRIKDRSRWRPPRKP